MKKKYLVLTFLLGSFLCPMFAQVGVGTTAPQGALDVSSTTNGMLIPRVSLTSATVANPVVNPQGGVLQNGTLVYNTAISGTAPDNVVPGFYYWLTNRWVAIAGGSVAPTDAWTINGNAGTNSSSNFLGTTDNVDLHFRTNGSNKFRLPASTNQILGYGGTAASPTYSWDGGTGSGMWLQGTNIVRFSAGGTARFQIPNANQVHGLDRGTDALPFYSWSADPNTGLFSPGADQLGLSTNGTERVRITNAGSVGIGVTTPNAALDVTSANNGFIAPRINLTALNASAPVVNPNGGGAPLAGTIVYNTATNGTAPNNVTPGYYYWDGARWVRMEGGASAPTDAWTINGNAGTDPNNNFVGTTDNVDFRVRTNNALRFNFTNNGRLRAYDNGTAALPTYSWNGDDNTGIWRPAADNLAFSTNGAERMRVLADGRVVVNGTAALTDGMFSSIATGTNVAIRASSVNGNLFRGTSTGLGNGVFADVVGTNNAGVAGGNSTGPGGVFVGQNMPYNFIAGAAAGFNGYRYGISTAYYTPGEGSSLICQDSFGGMEWEFAGWNATVGYFNVFRQSGAVSGLPKKEYAFSVMGPGQISTVVKDVENKNVTMNSVVAPENLLQDYGHGELVNGKAKIELDPNFAKNIIVSKEHALKVFIQLEGDCNGVFVTNKSGKGFEVKELANGSSNVAFTYTVIGVRADEVFSGPDGNSRTSSYVGRFRPAPELKKTEKLSNVSDKKNNEMR